MPIAFEWDERKNRANFAKHGVGFETAARVFDDPDALSFPERTVDDEERWQTIGAVEGVVLLTVAHTVRVEAEDEIVRIISARKATRLERRRYEEGEE